MPGANGIFVLSEIVGPLAERIRDVQRRFDPKLARETPPHVTLAGSSGVGPIVPSTPVERIGEALAPIAESTPVLELPVEPPHRFMQTNIVVLPLDPHGPLRRLHDRIARSGLTFARAKFTFTPAQIDEIKKAFSGRSFTSHTVDVRHSFSLFGKSYYLVVLAGRERRSAPGVTKLSQTLAVLATATACCLLFATVF